MSATSLPAVLTAARKAAGLSLADLAGLVGLTRAAVGHYETGAKGPPAHRLADLARACGVTISVSPAGDWSARRKNNSRIPSTGG